VPFSLGSAARAAVLVRWWAWWFNKVPLSVTLVLLLLDGRSFSAGALAVLALVVLTVCAVGNYGYALNDLFDVEEDRRAGRANAVAASGTRRMWTIVLASAACAEAFAAAAAGITGALITVVEIALPAAYSVPPLRIKERRWLGVAADGLAAHVYPALLALLAVAHWSLRPLTALLVVSVVVWSAAAGARGILSHQLHTADRDAAAGLRTIVHDLGAQRLERLIALVLIPLEVAGFGGALIACGGGIVLWAGVALYLLYEAYKTFSGRFRVTAFRPNGQPYVPFAEESFYKSWGPLVLALDCARADLRYLVLVAAYALLFRAHLRTEWARLGAVRKALRAPRATEPDARSSEGT
jgi:4-hydroxybenzoate polyprenyltransferase